MAVKEKYHLTQSYICFQKKRKYTAVFSCSSGQIQQCSRICYCIALDCDEFSRYLQTSASDTAISSYILTPQGQIAAHSDSSRNQTWISDSIKQMFLENTNSFFKDNDIYYNCRTLDNGWLHITEIPETISKAIHRY